MADTAHRNGVEAQSEGTVKQVNPVMGAGEPTRQRERELKEQRQEDKGAKCHRQGWSTWQPTGEADMDSTICCHLRET